MDKIRLGKTNLMVTRSGFGALPIQRVSFEEAKKILRKAYDSGINFFDTARMYSDSEEKIGYSLSDVRKNIVISTKSHAKDKKTLLKHLETSLKNLKTDYVDIIQLHNPDKLPDPDDPEGLYSGLLEAKKKGMTRFIGITNHKLDNALKAADSGLYDTIQFPLSSLSSDDDLKLISECKKRDIGVIAMKALSGGLITNAASTFAFLRQFNNVVPIWGIQRESELDEFIALEKNPPVLDASMWSVIKRDRLELAGDFCRGCGYCLPCAAGIEIPTCARISLLLRRAPYRDFMKDEFREKMELINNCIECGHCKDHCPYKLDTPNLLKKELKNYNKFYAEHKND
ncbi:MAG: aldo/keto reductase [Clostridium luticellarii]|jgi:aryl-alcohol dehydrogenase-like predicted oxidoreductase|uniref:aldo/keto reductase n=1 Tax=Clostridium luticellarii TaxID=1691940 RepID=UPI002357E0BF|nr:aldo/keto reductase [Clostridium luticellarii]MCI1996621.1 aldo/keto reductase [Clostridium luticellarii]MCI2040847.1 aldo/keto reductase [Clostridium luticellarii]